MPQVKINHSQIAEAAGVSRSTVSRALQNHPAISDEIKKKVQKLADEMGYRPNPLVSALMATRNRPTQHCDSATIALLTPWPEAIHSSTAFRQMQKGIKARAERFGFHVEQFWFNDPQLTSRRLSQILANRGIVAVLICPVPYEQKKLELSWEHFSLAYFTPNPALPVLNRASAFNFHSACVATRQLLALGYKRPCLAIRNRYTLPKHLGAHVIDQWVGGYFSAVVTQPKSNWVRPYISDTLEQEPFLSWCRRTRPDVVISNIPTPYEWLAQSPFPIAFACLDRQPNDVEIAGIDQRSDAIGGAAVDLIVDQMRRNERGIPTSPSNILIEGTWVDGPSAPRVPSKQTKAKTRS